MIGQVLLQRYQIIAELGRGGMGIVYRAHDPLLDREVAIKLVSLAQLSSEAEQRFRREAQLVANMDHPSIVPIYDLGAHFDSLFFVMPVVEGETLKSLLRRRALLLHDALDIVAQVAGALDHSHSQGVVHRDIKPGNVMVSWEGDGGRRTADGGPAAGGPAAGGPAAGGPANRRPRARVMDFGLALAGAHSRLTQTGKLPGTLDYLSPEQILSAEIDGRSDLFSLGTILYECLAGEPPFKGSRYTLLYRIAHEESPDLESRGVDPELADLVSSCLAKDPALRPARGNDIAAALTALRPRLVDADLRRAEGGAERSSPTVSTPLVGRRREAAALAQRLDESLAGECRFVVIGGEAGMGKTRLLEVVEQAAVRIGAKTLHGRFSGSSALPYQGFGELLLDYFRRREAGGSQLPDLHDLSADLLALFPVLREIAPLREAGPIGAPRLSAESAAADPTRIFELLARALLRLSGGRPLVLLLEHLHNTETSIEALQYIVQRLGSTPTLVVATYRPSEIDRSHPVARLLRTSMGDPRFTALTLEPLDRREHRELLATLLVGSTLSEELIERLYRASEGNPFFVQEWVRWLLETGDIRRLDDGTWVLGDGAAIAPDALPESIAQVVESRLELLPEEWLRMLQTASILGRELEYSDLEALYGGVIDDAVDELIDQGLLEEDPLARQDRLTFTSRLMRETLVGQLPRRRRRALHRRHAEQLEKRWAGRLHRVYGRLVQHFAAGDVPEKVIHYGLELARRALSGFGWESAANAIRTALDFIEDTPQGAVEESELRRLLATALRSEGHADAALKEAIRAARVAERAGHVGHAAAAARLAAEVAWQIRRIDETRHWVARGTDLARQAGDSRSLRQLLTLAATLANLGGEYDTARQALAEAKALAEGTTPEEEEEAPPPRGGTLFTSLPRALASYWPDDASGSAEAEVLGNVFQTVMGSDSQGHLIPILCHSFESFDDHRRFEFHLRPEVCFSDGTTMLASDVERSFRLAIERRSPAPALEILDAVEALEERRLSFRLRRPLPIFPALLSDWRTAVVRVADRDEDATGQPPLGTGPFRLGTSSEARFGSSPVLERNPNYWREPPLLDRVVFRVLPHAADVVHALRSGALDVGGDLSPASLEEIQRDSRFRTGLREATSKSVCFVLFRGGAAATSAVRRALCRGVRHQDLIWRTLGRSAQPANGLIPPGVLAHDPGRRHPLSTRDEARTWLAASGHQLPLRLRGGAHPHFLERYRALTEALFEEWSVLGVEVEIEELPAKGSQNDLDFLLDRRELHYDDPDNFTHAVLDPSAERPGTDLISASLRRLLERGRHETRPAARQKIYRRIENLIDEEAIALPLFHDIHYRIGGPRVCRWRLLGAPPGIEYATVGKSADEPRTAKTIAGQTGTLRVALPGLLEGLDPALATKAQIAEIIPCVFETLTRVEEGAHIVPSLASEFRVEKGGRRYRFRLRPGVRFHDGRRLGVRDVRYSFERLLQSWRGSDAAPLGAIRGARETRRGTTPELLGLNIVSARELVLELEEPSSFFPAMLASAMTAIVPEGSTVFDGDWRQGTAGSGPFRVVSFSRHRVELEANPHYWRAGRPRVDRLIFEYGLDSERVVEKFRAGRLALASHLRPADVADLLRDPEFAAGYLEAPGFSTCYLALDTRRGQLADLEVRRTLAAVLRAGDTVASTLGRLAVPAQGLIPPGLLGQTTAPPDLEVGDPSATLGGLELTVAVHPIYRDTYAAFWNGLREKLGNAGVGLVEVSFEDAKAPADGIRKLDLIATRWMADYTDSDSFVTVLHSRDGSDGRLCGSPEIDRWIERGRRESDPVARHAAYREIERLLREEARVIPLFHEQIYRFLRPGVQGLRLGLRAPEVAYEELWMED